MSEFAGWSDFTKPPVKRCYDKFTPLTIMGTEFTGWKQKVLPKISRNVIEFPQ